MTRTEKYAAKRDMMRFEGEILEMMLNNYIESVLVQLFLEA